MIVYNSAMTETACIILAAGKGVRLGLESLPKVMAGIYDRPLLHHTVEAVMKTNPDQIIIVTGHLGHVIKNYFGNEITYVEQTHLNGNAGALKEAMPLVKPEIKKLLVLQGDDSAFYQPETYRDALNLFDNADADITLLLTNDYNPQTFGNQYELESPPRVSRLIHPLQNPRNGMFPTGSFVAAKEVVSTILPGLHEINSVLSTSQIIIECLAQNGDVMASVVPQNDWYGINTPKDLSLSHNLMANRRR